MFLSGLVLLSTSLLQSMQQVEMKEKAAEAAEQAAQNCRVVKGNVCIASYELIEYGDCSHVDVLVDEQDNPLVVDPNALVVEVTVGKKYNEDDFGCFDGIWEIRTRYPSEICLDEHINLYLPLALFEGKKSGDVVSFCRKNSKDELVTIQLLIGEHFEDDIARCKEEYNRRHENPCTRLTNAWKHADKETKEAIAGYTFATIAGLFAWFNS